jgi:hypothetical protein
MATNKKMTLQELQGLALITLFEQGALLGADLMKRLGVTEPKEMSQIVSPLVRELGYIATEGEKAEMVFGLTEEGLTYTQENLVEEEEGQPEEAADDPSIVYEEEFAPAAPPTRKAPAKSPAKAPAPAPAPKKAGGIAQRGAPVAKAPAPAPKAASKGQSSSGEAKAASNKPARPVTFSAINGPGYTVESLTEMVRVGTEMAFAFAGRGGPEDLIVAELIMRGVSKCENQIRVRTAAGEA